MKDKDLQKKILYFCEQAIEIYQEYIDHHGYSDPEALNAAMREVQEGLDAEIDGI